MKLRNLFRTLVAACAFTTPVQAGASVILQVNSAGILTGATGVNVGGTLYDVTFAAGTCNSVFNNCVQSEFSFNTLFSASVAAKALIDQVFLNTTAGQFDSQPNKVFGCGTTTVCYTLIPYARVGNNVEAYSAYNDSSNYPDTIVPFQTLPTSTFGSPSYANYGVFKLAAPTAAVPEPSSIALMGLAMAGLAFARRRKS